MSEQSAKSKNLAVIGAARLIYSDVFCSFTNCAAPKDWDRRRGKLKDKDADVRKTNKQKNPEQPVLAMIIGLLEFCLSIMFLQL